MILSAEPCCPPLEIRLPLMKEEGVDGLHSDRIKKWVRKGTSRYEGEWIDDGPLCLARGSC